MPPLETISPPARNFDHGEHEVARFCFCSILAQIELSSCFRNDVEPLFRFFSQKITFPQDPYVLIIESSGTMADFVERRYQASIPDLMIVISFGRVVWMVEKAGAESSNILPGTPAIRHGIMLRCALNIARWWLVEFHERRQGSSRTSFPGEVAVPCGLMPLAMWLGVWEYGGIWRHGGGSEHYSDTEHLGGVGDNRMTALSDVLLVYGFSAMAGTVLRPVWYHDHFVEWAEQIAQFSVLPDIHVHHSAYCGAWCGMAGCPYPYVTRRIIGLSVTSPGTTIIREDSRPDHVYERMLYPQWGAELRHGDTGQVVADEEWEDENENDHSPMSAES